MITRTLLSAAALAVMAPGVSAASLISVESDIGKVVASADTGLTRRRKPVQLLQRLRRCMASVRGTGLGRSRRRAWHYRA